MSLPNLQEQLETISATLQEEGSLLALQNLLSSSQTALSLFTAPELKTTMARISFDLRKSLLPASVYHLVRSMSAKLAPELSGGSRVKSIHDIHGNFLWCDSNAHLLFNKSRKVLSTANLFGLMDRTSRQKIYAKHGSELLRDHPPRVISYLLEDQSNSLTSRCSLIMYSGGKTDTAVGVLVETRLARHSQQTLRLTLPSPFTPLFAQAPPTSFTPTLPEKRASSFAECPMSGLEWISISPFLKSTPVPKKKNPQVHPEISEFF